MCVLLCADLPADLLEALDRKLSRLDEVLEKEVSGRQGRGGGARGETGEGGGGRGKCAAMTFSEERLW